MGVLKTVWIELVSLFVDDGSLAAATVVWLGICWLLSHLGIQPIFPPVILFLGLILLLAESTLRRAGKRS